MTDAERSFRDAPGSATSLRAANQRRVLDLLLAASGPLTQADLTRESGLAAGTVSSIVRELAAADVVTTVAGSGRRGTTVRLARGAGLVAGVDFGHSHLAVAVGDMTGQVLGERRESLDTHHEAADGLDRAVTMLGELLGDVGTGPGKDKTALRTIGLGLPAPIADGLVMSSGILPGWVGVNARELAQRRFGVPVRIDNDANLGALAEHRHGVGRGHHDLVYVKVSSGVGAGLIIDDTLFRGARGTAGEIGHLTLDEQGPLCRCGSRGCLEAYAASGTTLAMMAEQLPGASIEEVAAAARTGNVAAQRAFEDAGLHLGWGLAALVNLVNPAVVIVGGDIAAAADLVLDSTRQGLRRHVLAGATNTPILVGALGDRAAVVGALVLAVDCTDLLPDVAAVS